jgi:predicted DNA-binding transcriptional regulator YafY
MSLMARAARGSGGGAKERASNVDMVRRVKEVIALASGPTPPTRQELADRFGISKRQVSNIINFMRELGVEVAAMPRPSDARIAYVVRASDFLKLDMSVGEAVASVLIIQSVLGTPLSTDDAATESGTHRIASSLGSEVRRKLDRLRGRFAIRLLKAAKEPRKGTFRTVLDGILENRVLLVDYESPHGKPLAAGTQPGTAPGKARRIETVAIEPYGVFFARRSWYLAARKRPAHGMRLYKLARFRRVTLGEQRFDFPPDWTVDGFLRTAWEVMPDDGSVPRRIVIDVDATVAGNVVETRWHPSQSTTATAGGGARLTFEAACTDEVMWWVLGMGRHARVIAPAELKAKVAREIAAMAQDLRADRALAGGSGGSARAREH